MTKNNAVRMLNYFKFSLEVKKGTEFKLKLKGPKEDGVTAMDRVWFC
jgi:hypothetical protein